VARDKGGAHGDWWSVNRGLATAYQAGCDAARKLGADVIVNTEAEGQNSASDIPRVVEPILARRADMVVGDRQVQNVEHFSPTKKLLQRLCSWGVRRAPRAQGPGTTSGFPAFNRQAPPPLPVVSPSTS